MKMSEQQEYLISRYDDPDLSGQERSELAALLKGNEEAQALLEEYRHLDGHLAMMGQTASPVSVETFVRAVHERIDATSHEKIPAAASRPKRSVLRFPGWMRPIAAAAAAVAVVLLAWMLFPSRPGLSEPERVEPIRRVHVSPAATEPTAKSLVVVRLEGHGVRNTETARKIQLASMVDYPTPASAGVDEGQGEVLCYAVHRHAGDARKANESNGDSFFGFMSEM